MENRHVNAIVVGSGAGGGTVAEELAVAGLTVGLFGRGRLVPYDHISDDELPRSGPRFWAMVMARTISAIAV